MTKLYEECMLEILQAPESDAPRAELASIVEAWDPAWAELIRLQLDLSKQARARSPHGTSLRVMDLIDANGQRWSRDLDFYVGGERPVWVDFHRGLPWRCTMSAYAFLEHGEYVMSRIAPLRGITFYADPEGDPFPVEALAASPLLRRLDMIGFHRNALAPGQLETLLASPHLERALCWDIRDNPVTLETFEAFAANEHTRHALTIRSDFQVPSDKGPIGEVWAKFDIYPWHHFGVSREGAALEQKHGYLPWLHIGNHSAYEDAQYWVENKILPLYEPGSPVDALVRYGRGFGEEPALEPRSEFILEAFNSTIA